MLRAQATAMKSIGLRLSPMPRKIELRMLYATIKGMPAKQMRRYARAPGTASGGVDSSWTIGCVSPSRAHVASAAIIAKRVIVFPMARRMPSSSSAPTKRPIMTVVPMARPTIMTVTMCMTCEPIETAEMTSAPLKRPAMSRSASP